MLPTAARNALVSLVIATGSLLATPAATAPAANDEVRALNGELLRLQSEARRMGGDDVEERAAALLAARAKALRTLIARDASAAASVALPPDVLRELSSTFPTQKANLEQRGRWNGELEYLIEDDAAMRGHRKVFRLHRGAEVLEMQFAGREPPRLVSGQMLSVGGVRAGRALAVTEMELLDAFQDGGGTTTADENAAGQCSTTGAQSVLTVLVQLPGYKLPPAVTADFMRGVILGNAAGGTQSSPDWNLDDFWRQSSDGRTWVDPGSTVIGPITLDSDFNKTATGAATCDNYGLRDAVIAAIDGQVDFRNYTRILIVMPGNGTCTWAGTANVGCRTMSSAGDGSFNASVAWQRAETMTTRERAVQLTTHEIGHNLTMSHAGSRDFGAEALGGLGEAGTLSEYGDPFSTMGSWNFGFYAASHAANQLRWLDAGTHYRSVETSGTYTIANYEARGGAARALRVRRGTGNNAWLWLESRQNVAPYSSQLGASAFGGALIHYEDGTTGNDSHLLDFTTTTTSFGDAPLAAGRTWTDPFSNLSITVNSVAPGGMTVTVNYGPTECTSAAPLVTMSPSVTSAEQGSALQMTVTVRNASSQPCGSETFALIASAPGGWSPALGNTTLTIAPGQQLQTTLQLDVPAAQALGTYPVTVVARSGSTSLAASATGNVTVTEAAPTCNAAAPTITVTPDATTAQPGASVPLTLTVRNNSSSACEAETVVIDASLPASWSKSLNGATKTVAPGAEAQAQLTVTVPTDQASGTYPVNVSVKSVGSGLSGAANASVKVAEPEPPPCTESAPAVSLSPANAILKPGDALQLAMTVRNASSSTCETESFRLGATVPSGWSDAFGETAVQLAPGAQITVPLSLAVPASSTPGDYTVQAQVASAASGLSAASLAKVTVQAPPPPACSVAAPTLTVTPTTAALTPGATVQLTLSLRNNSSSTCAAETYALDAAVPGDWARFFSTGQSMTLAPGAQGSTTVSVQASAAASAGTYPVGLSAVGASSGLVATQAVSITVNVPVSTPPPETPPPTTPPPTSTPPPEKTPTSSVSSGSGGGGGGSADPGLLLLSLMLGAISLRRRFRLPLPR